MKILFMICISAIIGAGIGGFTNYMAIRMLFRPYHPLTIGKWTVPFTPGVIPKRHEELSRQLGQLVEEQLLTPETINKTLTSSFFQQEIQQWVIEQAQKLMNAEITLRDIVHAGSESSTDHQSCEVNLRRQIKKVLILEINKIDQRFSNKKIKEWVPIKRLLSNERFIFVSHKLIQRLELFLQSEEGESLLYQWIQQAIQSQGTWAKWIGSLMPKEALVDRVKTVLIASLQHPETQEKLLHIMNGMLTELAHKSISEMMSKRERKQIGRQVIHLLVDHVSFSSILDRPIKNCLYPWKEHIEKVIEAGFRQLYEKIKPEILFFIQKGNIAEIVEEQIQSFPLSRVEEIVRHLAKRELKMVTTLGALLGGVIGAIQALILYVFFLL